LVGGVAILTFGVDIVVEKADVHDFWFGGGNTDCCVYVIKWMFFAAYSCVILPPVAQIGNGVRLQRNKPSPHSPLP
jgi:hypothetical protein